eukprot:TRINITY_DN5380_c2_g1_i1.p1 TRINITY_DN5380_c2_g1~~TRINITY_DN5380_c2_g1_i1.p1  ORF type:complete len:218 (+),score=46.21 TRINITY_DN5380_c2_g1_i1:55-708(+)
MAAVLQSIEDQYRARQAPRPVGWEDSLRRWRVRKIVKKHRTAVREGNEEMAKSAVNQYGKAVEQVARLMRIDPLNVGSGGGAKGTTQKAFGSKENQFMWSDQDTVGQGLFIPKEVDMAQNSVAIETSGDRRKRAIEESRNKSEHFASERKAKRRKEVESITETTVTERGEEDIMKHNWSDYKTSLEQQKKAVEEQARKLQSMASAKDRFADILSDSD